VPHISSAGNDDLIGLASLQFGELSEAELRLLRAAPLGEVAVCGPNLDPDDPQNIPANADDWGPDREVRAKLIACLCRERQAADQIDERGIQAYAGRVTGELDLSFVGIAFPLSFARCSFHGPIYLTHATLRALNLGGSWTKSLHGDGVTVSGDVLLRDGFVANGRVEIRDAQIGGNLLCDGSRFENPGGKALLADRVKVEGSVFLKDGFSAAGEVRFLGASVGSNFECGGGRFSNPGSVALVADHIRAEGSIFLRNGFSAEGVVWLIGARFGILDCEKGVFKNKNGIALSCENATARGNVFLRDGFRAEGRVSLLGSQIGGGIDCRAGVFESLDLRATHIRGFIRWQGVSATFGTRLDLRNAEVGAVMDEKASWPQEHNLGLDGFTYGSIAEGPTDAEARLQWISRAGKFTLQPYRQLAKVLRETGDERGSRRVLFEMEDRRRMEQDQGSLGRFISWVLKWTIGYGQMSWRALWWLLGLTVLGSIVFGAGYLGGTIAPNDKEAYAVFQQRGYPPDYYPSFNPLVYSFEHSFPLINFGVKDHWAPSLGVSAKMPLVHCWGLRWMRDAAVCGVHVFRLGAPGLLRWCIWLQVPLGWGFATLFVAGLTGIVKSG
jgi:hypothetical protein